MNTANTANTATIHKIHSGWGDHIEWADLDWEKQKFKAWGHLPWKKRIKEGDFIEGEFSKGTIRWKVLKVEWMSDPHDMFFADVEPMGYVWKDGTMSEEPEGLPR